MINKYNLDRVDRKLTFTRRLQTTLFYTKKILYCLWNLQAYRVQSVTLSKRRFTACPNSLLFCTHSEFKTRSELNVPMAMTLLLGPEKNEKIK